MSALPPNWEWDYDGTRWFYRYKPNGYVQFHFPKEGDEFPDFIDALSPMPDLAPEEKLESQQQLKRRPGFDADSKSKIRATGGPLGDLSINRSGFGGPLNNDDDGFFYQPENFMYLGPGAYTDVSPLVDEEEKDELTKDRRKSNVNGGQDEGRDKAMLDATSSRKIIVSPLQSQTNTPSVAKSVPALESPAVPQPIAKDVVLVINTQDFPGPTQPGIPSFPGVPLLDSVEKPHHGPAASIRVPSWDPVGIMAEMATEHTAAAHIETHPDPVEMGDNAVLAPIEMMQIVDLGIAELPERTSPSDARPSVQSIHDLLHKTSMTDHALLGATFRSGSRLQNSSPTKPSLPTPDERPVTTPAKLPSDDSLPEVAPQPSNSLEGSVNGPFSIKRKPSKTEPKQVKYQPYVPGSVHMATPEKLNRDPAVKTREHRNPLAREASLMLGTRQIYGIANVPTILQPPKVPPKHLFDSSQSSVRHPVNPAQPDATRTQTEPAAVLLAGVQGEQAPGFHTPASLQHVPSVLKPARGHSQGKHQDSSTITSDLAQDAKRNESRTPPTQMCFQSGCSNQRTPKGTLYSAFQKAFPSNRTHQPLDTLHSDQIPHSLTLAPSQQQLPGPRPGVQRVETAPTLSPSDHHLPGSRIQLQEGCRLSQPPALPQFLRRPRGQSNFDQTPAKHSYAQSAISAARPRSNSDVPQHLHSKPAELLDRSEAAFKPISESRNLRNVAFKPQSAMDFMRGSSQPSTGRVVQHPNYVPSSNYPRQTSYADSEVSSLGPLSEGQSSEQLLQTPSPLESVGRRPSSGFFRGTVANAHPEGSRPSIVIQNPAAFNDQNGPIRSPDSRPVSFSGPSPTSTQPTTPGSAGFDMTQNPSAVPGKIRIHPPPGNPQIQVPTNRTGPVVVEAPESPSNRQYSLPTEQRVPSPEHSRIYPYEKSSSNMQPQPQPHQRDQGITGPHSTQINPSHTTVASSRASKPPYSFEASRTDRPQRPTVTPSTQQYVDPMSPRTPGHILQPIQEHTVGDLIVHPPVTGPENPRRHSPASNRRLSTGPSHYPSSAESPNEQNISKILRQELRFEENPEAMSPVMPTAGQTYSPVQNNPFQQSPTNVAGYSAQQVTRPGSTPPVVKQSPKDREHEGWISKFMNGPGKPDVLQKPQPPPAFSEVPRPPTIIPLTQASHSPSPLAFNATSSELVPPQQIGWSITNNQLPIHPPLTVPIVPVPQSVSNQKLPHQPGDRRGLQMMPQHPAMTSGSQEAPNLEVQQQLFPWRRPGQSSANIAPPELSAAPEASTEQTVDKLSDAASVSAISISTVDLPEARAKPLTKPQLVTAERRVPSPEKDQLPSRLAMNQSFSPQPSVTKPDQTQYDPSPPMSSELTVAPLFSKTPAKATVSSISTGKVPVPNDKWAKRPAADYSGDDWGDDPWDYQ